jgi:hypothetical protein
LRHFGGRKDAGGRLGKVRAPSRSIVFSTSIAADTGSCGTFESKRSAAGKRGLNQRSNHGCSDRTVLVRDLGDCADDRQGVVQPWQPDLAVHDRNAILARLLRLLPAMVRRNSSSAFATSRLVARKRRSSRFCALLKSDPMSLLSG